LHFYARDLIILVEHPVTSDDRRRAGIGERE
jgi:hypothetical protein